MVAAGISVRPLVTEAEVDMFFRRCVRAYWPDGDQEQMFSWWRSWTMDTPGMTAGHCRGVFQGQELVGGLVVYDRIMRMSPAQLRVCGIGLVFTVAEYRGLGVARAALEDTIITAEAQGYDLLMLGGVPNIYNRLGFVDIFDGHDHLIERDYVLEQPPTDHQVRAATADDIETLLDLYARHHHGYVGSFNRLAAEQAYRMSFRADDNPVRIVETADGTPAGYMIISSPDHASEVAVDSWPAALALLQYHACHVDIMKEVPAELRWTVPPTSPTMYYLLDNITFPMKRPLPPYPNWFIVRSLQSHMPHAGWMARPANLSLLLEHLIPRWSVLSQSVKVEATDTVALTIGESAIIFMPVSGAILTAESDTPATWDIRLTQDVFMQLLFGFRPVAWAVRQTGQQIPDTAVPLLERLFPFGQTWIAASDGF